MDVSFFESQSATFLALVSVIGVFLYWYTTRSRNDLPPGPKPLPVIGNMHLMKGKFADTLKEIGQDFGDMFTIYYGSRPYVVLNTYAIIREAFLTNGAAFASRPHNIIRRDISEYRGIVMNDGPMWKEQRSFAVSHLKELGFGKVSFEPIIQEEARSLLHVIKSYDGRPVDPKLDLANAICNVICHIVLGRRFQYGDEKIARILDCMGTFSKTAQHVAMMDIFPILRIFKFLPGDLLNYHKILGSVADIEHLLQGIVDEHRENFDPSNIRDFVDSYLLQMTKEPEETNFTDKQLLKVLNELFIGGTESTQTALRWIFIILLRHPEVYQTARKEILEIVGEGRLPSLSDRESLPYCQAVITEAHRLSMTGHIGMMHCTSRDVTLRGYTIPAGTSIIQNTGAANSDPQLWDNPDDFVPKRFLDKAGKFSTPDYYMPFGIGPRSCIGSTLAKMELFLFTTAILQNFVIRLPDGAPLPTMDGILGITYSPHPYQICFVEA